MESIAHAEVGSQDLWPFPLRHLTIQANRSHTPTSPPPHSPPQHSLAFVHEGIQDHPQTSRANSVSDPRTASFRKTVVTGPLWGRDSTLQAPVSRLKCSHTGAQRDKELQATSGQHLRPNEAFRSGSQSCSLWLCRYEAWVCLTPSTLLVISLATPQAILPQRESAACVGKA